MSKSNTRRLTRRRSEELFTDERKAIEEKTDEVEKLIVALDRLDEAIADVLTIRDRLTSLGLTRAELVRKLDPHPIAIQVLKCKRPNSASRSSKLHSENRPDPSRTRAEKTPPPFPPHSGAHTLSSA